MKLNSIRRAAALGLSYVALASAPAARAEDKMTAQSLIDRQLILDQITRYYYNFGKAERQAEGVGLVHLDHENRLAIR